MPRRRRALWTCVAAALVLILGVGAPEEDESLRIALAESRAVARAAGAVRKSIVALRALGTGRDAYGTGIIVAPDGRALTALHVVDGATAIAVVLDGGEEFPGRLRAWDRSTDLALLEIVAEKKTFEPAPLAPDHVLDVGETVVALSNPFGLGTSVTKGVLSATGRRNVVEGQEAALIQTDAAINPGSSGGALVNLRGEVIGLITAIITRSGGHQGVGLAVPAHELRRALARLTEGAAPPRAWLGVRIQRDPVRGEGLRILEVAPKGPAAAAGFREGDILRCLAGRALGGLDDLREALAEAKAGDSLPAVLGRKGEILTLTVQVGVRG